MTATALDRGAIIVGLRDLVAEHGWDAKWLNFEVTRADAIATRGRAVEWETIHDEDGIVIEVASNEAMLVMKLRANRPGRDTRDIRLLLALCEVHTLEDAGDLSEQFYPGDILTPRAETIVNAILDGAPTTAPDSPGPIDI